MNKKNLLQEMQEKHSADDGIVYFPFVEGEIVTNVLFSESTNYKIKTVEGNTSISTGEAKSIDIGTTETACLVIETEKAVTVKVITIK